MVPYLLASLGTMLGGLTGVFSVAQEGVMVLGASVGFLVSYGVGSNTVGILAAAASARVFGLLLGAATTTCGSTSSSSAWRCSSPPRGWPACCSAW